MSSLHFRLVNHLLDQERFRDAFNILQKLLVNDDPLLMWKRGVALTGLSDYDQALVCFNSAIEGLDGYEQAACLLDFAILDNRINKPDQALEYVNQAFALFEKLEKKEDLLKCEVVRLVALQKKGQHTFFLQSSEKLLAKLKFSGLEHWQVILALVSSTCYYVIGNLQCAQTITLEYMPLARKLHMFYRLCGFEIVLSQIAFQENKFEVAVQHAKQAQVYAAITGSVLSQADVQMELGVQMYGLGKYADSRAYLIQAQQLFTQCGYSDGQVLSIFNLGILDLDQGNYQAALRCFKQSLDVIKDKGYARSASVVYLYIGLLQSSLGNSSSAFTYLTQALIDFEKTARWSWAAWACANLMSVCAKDQISYYETKTQGYINQGLPSIYLTKALIGFGENLMRVQKFVEAYDVLVKATNPIYQHSMPTDFAYAQLLWVECLLVLKKQSNSLDLAGFDIESLFDQVDKKVGYLPEFALRVSTLRANYAQSYRDFDKALAHLKDTIKHVQQLRYYADDLVLASMLAGKFEPVYQNAIQLANDLNQPTICMQMSLYRRAEWLRKNQLSMLNESQFNESLIPQRDSLQELRMLYGRVSRTGGVLHGQAAERMQVLIADFAKLYRKIDFELMSEPQLNYAAKAKTPPPILDIDQISNFLIQRFGSNWIVITFEISTNGWVMLVLTARGLMKKFLQPTRMIETYLQFLTNPTLSYRKLSYVEDSLPLKEVSNWLGIDVLLKDVLDMQIEQRHEFLPHVIISDCEPFSRLSFSALPLQSGKRLGQSAIVHFVPTLGLNGEVAFSNASLFKRVDALFVAPIEFENLPPLYSGLGELKISTNLFNVRILKFKEASVDNLQKMAISGELNQYQLIYFSTHGSFDAKYPRLSSLAMSDGQLMVQDVLSWKLNGQAIVLGGCDTARAITYGGEERLGIENAFLAAGASEILTAMWPVKDRRASVFLQNIMARYCQTPRDSLYKLTNALTLVAQSLTSGDLFDWAGWRVMNMM